MTRGYDPTVPFLPESFFIQAKQTTIVAGPPRLGHNQEDMDLLNKKKLIEVGPLKVTFKLRENPQLMGIATLFILLYIINYKLIE